MVLKSQFNPQQFSQTQHLSFLFILFFFYFSLPFIIYSSPYFIFYAPIAVKRIYTFQSDLCLSIRYGGCPEVCFRRHCHEPIYIILFFLSFPLFSPIYIYVYRYSTYFPTDINCAVWGASDGRGTSRC